MPVFFELVDFRVGFWVGGKNKSVAGNQDENYFSANYCNVVDEIQRIAYR